MCKCENERMCTNIILQKSYTLSFEIAKYLMQVQKDKKEFVLTKQLLRSITSVGANIFESQGAQTKKDFLLKTSIAYKEAYESKYWIYLLRDLNLIDRTNSKTFIVKCDEILKILGKIKITTRKSLQN